MPSGPDIATPQRKLNIAKVSSNWDFCIVKAGGANTGSLYVSPYYKKQITAVADRKIPKVHYWMIGGMNPTTQAQFFARHLQKFNKYKDNIMLDNERIDKNRHLFTTAECITFLETARKILGLPAKRCWIYANTSDMKTLDLKLIKTHGYRLHVAAYPTPNNGTRHDSPGMPYDIWQYTSAYRITGINTDFNYTKHSINSLFGSLAPEVGVPRTTTSHTGETGTHSNFWKRMHMLAEKAGYTGPIHDYPNVTMWIAVQSYLRNNYKYRGPRDGHPGKNTYKALQRLGTARGGYNGPIDGVPGDFTWMAVAKYLNTL